jgi:hypothetical protein
MSEIILTAFVAVPLIIGLVGSVIVWRLVTRPWLFLVISVLVLLGLQSLFAPAVTSVFYGTTGSLSQAAAHEAFVHGVIIGALGNAVLGIPLLWWLFRGLHRA